MKAVGISPKLSFMFWKDNDRFLNLPFMRYLYNFVKRLRNRTRELKVANIPDITAAEFIELANQSRELRKKVL